MYTLIGFKFDADIFVIEIDDLSTAAKACSVCLTTYRKFEANRISCKYNGNTFTAFFMCKINKKERGWKIDLSI